MFQQVGDNVREIIDRQAGKSFLVQQSYRLAEIGSTIFQIGDGAAVRAMIFCNNAAIVYPVQVSATETATQVTFRSEGAPGLHA